LGLRGIKEHGAVEWVTRGILIFSPYQTLVNKSRRMRYGDYVTGMGEKEYAY